MWIELALRLWCSSKHPEQQAQKGNCNDQANDHNDDSRAHAFRSLGRSASEPISVLAHSSELVVRATRLLAGKIASNTTRLHAGKISVGSTRLRVGKLAVGANGAGVGCFTIGTLRPRERKLAVSAARTNVGKLAVGVALPYARMTVVGALRPRVIRMCVIHHRFLKEICLQPVTVPIWRHERQTTRRGSVSILPSGA